MKTLNVPFQPIQTGSPWRSADDFVLLLKSESNQSILVEFPSISIFLLKSSVGVSKRQPCSCYKLRRNEVNVLACSSEAHQWFMSPSALTLCYRGTLTAAHLIQRIPIRMRWHHGQAPLRLQPPSPHDATFTVPPRCHVLQEALHIGTL